MYRVSVQGKFHDLSPSQRARLVKQSDVAQMAFTESGTFTCDRTASVFTFRCSVAAGPDLEDVTAIETALGALTKHGYPHTVVRATATNMGDVKVRRRGR